MMSEYILSINPCVHGLNYHDPSVAIISEGKILFAIEEERLNGIKGSKGIFPAKAIKYALDYCRIKESDITGIAVGYDPMLWQERKETELLSILRKNTTTGNGSLVFDTNRVFNDLINSDLFHRYEFFSDRTQVCNYLREQCGFSNKIRIEFFPHHLSHVASSYEVSGFDCATGIVIDGIGEVATTSIWEINGNEYKLIKQIDYPNSLGYFYAVATKFLGFEPWHHEGKTMALAAYGHKNSMIDQKLSTLFSIKEGIYDCSEFIYRNSALFLMVDMDKAIAELEQLFGVKARDHSEPISDFHMDFAFAVQMLLENSVISVVNYGIEKTGITQVCASGGIFMNCKMNMVVREQSKASDYFVQPLAGDLGLVLGSGLLLSSSKYTSELYSVSLGPDFSDEYIESILKKSGLKYMKSPDIAYDVAKLLSENNIVCWFEGRMEMGARALGNRSILANPRDAQMSDKINELVKHREVWRPFACSILEEYCEEVLENYHCQKRYPFMIEAFRVKDNWRDKIPAVIHRADYTTRPQTVSCKTNPLYYDAIKHFYEITGCPLVLNTSFNDKGQPIIMSPELAVDFIKKNPVDVLAIGNYLVINK